MLKLLEEIPNVEPTEALSRAADLLLPNPSEETVRDPEVGEKVIAKIKDRLRIKKDDTSVKAIGRIYDALASEMLAYSLTSEQEKQARIRLGQRGELRPSLYRIDVPDAFLNDAKKLGVRRSHVEDVLRCPDMFEHLQSNVAHAAISLYAKKISPPNGDNFTWLVITRREETTQSISAALRLYDTDFPELKADKLIDLLMAFLEVFGFLLRVKDKPPTRLILNEQFSDPPGFKIDPIYPEGKPTNFLSVSVVRPIDGIIYVALAYVINLGLYSSVLNRHGVAAFS